MKLLLDTHAFLWHAVADPRLPVPLRAAIEDPANAVWLSAASIWEAAIKITKGRLHVPGQSVDFLLNHAEAFQVRVLPITTDHIRQTQRLPLLHGDPFDRLIVAQAQIEGVHLVTVDSMLRQYPVPTLW